MAQALGKSKVRDAAALREFLAAGDRPIVFVGADPTLASAIKKRRLVFVDCDGEVARRENSVRCDRALLDELLPRAAVAVYEGDPQTCAAALRAGVPQLIAGGGRESKSLGKMLRALGVGRRASPLLTRPNVVASMIAEMLASKGTGRRCAEIADAIREGRAAPEVRRLIELPHETPPTPASVDEDPTTPVVSMSSLGRFGRFGNQLLQYAFLRIVAKNNGFGMQVPEWPGEVLFGHRDPRPKSYLPPAAEKRDDGPTMFEAEPALLRHFEIRAGAKAIRIDHTAIEKCPPNVDLCGNFMFHTSLLASHKEFFRSLYRPVDEIRNPLEAAIAALREHGKTIIGIHARRGDFVDSPLSTFTFVVPDAWWRDWVRRMWDNARDPVLYIASDEPGPIAAALKEFKPVTANDLAVKLPASAKGLGYFVDHYVLSHCDRAAISNSSFGFTASMLNESGTEFFRATPDPKQPFVKFEPWDAEPLLHLSTLSTRKTLRDIVRLTMRTQGIGATLSCLGYYLPKAWLRTWTFRASMKLSPKRSKMPKL